MLAPLLKHITLEPDEDLARRPPALRFIVSGAVEVNRNCRALPHGRQVRGPGSLLGLRTLAEWSKDQEVRPGEEARARVRTQLLELQCTQFKQAFQYNDTLLARLLAAHEADARAVDLVRVLSESPRLANAQDADLFRLAEGAAPVELNGGPEGTPLFSDPVVPEGFYVVLRGHGEVVSASGPVTELEAPTCVGLENFLAHKPLAGPVMLKDAGQGALAFHIRGEWFNHVRATEPDFDRAVTRGSPELLDAPPPPAAHQVIVWGESEKDMPPWSALGRLLAERMAVHLQEHVLVVRLVEGASPQGHFTPQRPARAMNGWVADCERPPTRTDGEPLLPPSTMTTWWSLENGGFAGRINVTLVDTSALTAEARQEVLQQLARETPAEVPIKYLHLSRSRQPPTLELPDRVKRINTGVLSDDETGPGPGLSLASLMNGKAPLTKRDKAARAAALVTGAARRKLRQLRTASRSDEPPEWPMGTVRVRFPASWRDGAPLPTSLEGRGQEVLRERFERWARAATGRRVGLALGGGGSFGFVSIALLRRLDLEAAEDDAEESSRLRVPIDMVSGSSFGAVVGAFYCVGGRKALALLEQQSSLMLPIIGLSALSSAILEWWTDLQLGGCLLDELEVPFFPVVTDADVGVEWDLRTGSVGRGIRASSSLPPLFGPTLIGNRRLLDGGLVANVPTDVLRTEGADILIAANPISRVSPRKRSFPRPWTGDLWRQLNPCLRIKDSFRMLQIMGRLSGGLQDRDGGAVMYQPERSSIQLLDFKSGRRIVERAHCSLEVSSAALRARTAWRRRLNNSWWLRSRPRSANDTTPEQIELALPLVFRDLQSRSELRSTSDTVLSELAEYLHTQKAIESFQIQLTAPDEATARRRARALADYLKLRIFQKEVKVGEPALLERAEGQSSRVELTVLKTRTMTGDVMLEAAGMLETYRGYLTELRQAQANVRMRTLLSEADQQVREGAPELARLLALEATEYVHEASNGARPGPRRLPLPLESQTLLDEVLRAVLEHRGLCLRVLSNGSATLCAAWSPDGRYLATGDRTGTVRIWDLHSPWKEPESLTVDESANNPGVNALAWAGRDNLLASVGNDCQVRVMRVGEPGARVVHSHEGGTQSPWGLRFSPRQGLLLGPFSEGGSSRSDTSWHAGLLSVARKKLLPVSDSERVTPGLAEVRDAVWAPDGKRFATAGRNEVGIWRVERRDSQHTVSKQEAFPVKGVRTVAWHPWKPVLAAGGAKGAALLRGSGSGKKVEQLETPGPVEHVAWSSDGRWLAGASARALRIWHTDSGHLLNVLPVEGDPLEGVTWNPRRPGVLATWSGNQARVWHAESGQTVATLTGHSGRIHQVAWSPDGRRLVTVSADATARIWDDTLGGPERHDTWDEVERRLKKDGTLLHPPELPLKPGTPGTAWARYSPRRPHQAALPAAAHKSLPLWEGHDFSTAPGVKGRGFAACWSPDGKHVAVQDGARSFSLWTDSGEREASVNKLPHDLTRLVWHPSGHALGLALKKDKEPRFWDVTRAELMHPSGAEQDRLWDLAWSPSGKQLAIACNDGWARIYDCPSVCALGKPLWSLRLMFAACRVSWSPDGQFLATGDAGGLVGIWDSRGYDLVASPQTRWGGIEHLAWNASGSCLFSASRDGRGLLWRQGSDGRWMIAAALESEPAPLRWAAFTPDGRWLVTMAADGSSLRLHPATFETLVDRVAAMPSRNEFAEHERTHYLQCQDQRWKCPPGTAYEYRQTQ
ncbi:patatin-like phospholipase family protein [Pyxidicoccus sp. MSG2]|uniref:patatin-like phospholipase family protein n=1 Tax=Pyxidicoccus sp. MSG2 TaxID=2996790 RepID=UPI00226DF331|nr:patatin-like phospholipase family protein [Pyxidicoccus sp. MSG2]MCY1019764.1 hypothetical protein [Pyxidicoccus sp. MSG2]